ncbi:hypothetical protein FPSE_10549 [Fusarium pseudograminearum CS3096]|uniref:Uncharacterized protein n=1 Tax=Fusarium pseudograminearum (strain CS3096) TaxID=1028729 RepID=K3UCV3_FUSPC|nr:hypothetical protein FPSE_10549 [Fusarium pseudograminearum CS3096]EKJ69296.1 hypothetical protein FPSE_10549 [Fusarium pseudograminearum CS3096]KAF0638601.1 hypothetical protein FPSE5266_10549 [Fusarium pseudograminearum]
MARKYIPIQDIPRRGAPPPNTFAVGGPESPKMNKRLSSNGASPSPDLETGMQTRSRKRAAHASAGESLIRRSRRRRHFDREPLISDTLLADVANMDSENEFWSEPIIKRTRLRDRMNGSLEALNDITPRDAPTSKAPVEGDDQDGSATPLESQNTTEAPTTSATLPKTTTQSAPAQVRTCSPSDRTTVEQERKTLGERIAHQLLASKRLRDERGELWKKMDQLEQRIHGHQEIMGSNEENNGMVQLRMELCEELQSKLSGMYDDLGKNRLDLDKSTLKVDLLLKEKVTLVG